MKLAVPNIIAYEKLFNNSDFIDNVKDLQIFKVNEEDTYKLLLAKKVDAALLSPLGYGLGVDKADFRIIPETALSTVDYTGLASIFFRQGLQEISKVASNRPNDYLIKIGGILLAEKYGFDVELFEADGGKNDILKKFDAAIIREQSHAADNALDVSDEWFDMYEMPLPLLAWVTWQDATPEKLIQYIRNIATIGEGKEENIIETSSAKTDYNLREGQLFWSWTEEVEKAFEQMLQFLYFHQFFSHIPAIKVFGRD